MGYAGVAAYKAEMEQTHNYVALVDCGDAVQGGAIGTLSGGAYLVDIMNETGYDFATFGNHEFDYKIPQLTKLTKYEYLACNFKYLGKGTSDIAYKPYEIVDYGGTKVAYIGIATPESFVKSTPAYFQDANGNYIYSFCEDDDGSALYKLTRSKRPVPTTSSLLLTSATKARPTVGAPRLSSPTPPASTRCSTVMTT